MSGIPQCSCCAALVSNSAACEPFPHWHERQNAMYCDNVWLRCDTNAQTTQLTALHVETETKHKRGSLLLLSHRGLYLAGDV